MLSNFGPPGIISGSATAECPLIVPVLMAAKNRGLGRSYSNWQAVHGDTSGSLFDAICEQDGMAVRIWLLSWISKNAQARQELQERLNGLHLLRLSSSVGIIEFNTEDGSPRLVFKASHAHRPAEVKTQLPLDQRLELAIELCHSLNELARFRIDCETLTIEDVRVRSDEFSRPSLELNYLAKYLSELTYKQARKIEISDVRNALSNLIGEGIGEQSEVEVPARLQVILKRLLSDREDEEELDEFLVHAQGTLQEIIDVINPRTDTTAMVSLDRMTPSERIAGPDDYTAEAKTGEIDVLVINDSTVAFSPSQMNQARKPSTTLVPGDQLGRYRLEKILGEGGMGCVFKAVDITNQNEVAIKVLRSNHSDIAQAVRRFKKEARILASVQNQYVTQLYEVGVENGQHFLAMEYVEGIDLKGWLRDRLPVKERDALRIVADIARGLVDAHQKEIVHRDIKPENILLKRIGENEHEYDSYQVKLTDFGIARHVNQSASLEVTRAGTLLGTPSYMSPEQCKATGDVGPAADVYSLGITLYLLLCGELPFVANDPMKLAAMHCFESVPNIQKRNSEISDPAAELLYKMLAKTPEHRFSDAAQLVRAIDQMISGQSSDLAMHPKPPEAGSGKVWRRDFEWELKSSPEELWPQVSNTDRLNRAAGLQSVQYKTVQDEKLGLRKFGSFRLGGMQIEWEEHPFEWVEGHRMGVLREFASGPFQWFMSSVELIRKPDGGSKLKHNVQILPRNTLGRVVSTVEAGWKGFRALDRIYKRIDESIQNKNSREIQDPFETPEKLSSAQSKRIEERIGEVSKRGIDVDVAARLADFVRNASPQSLAHIRPYDLATQLGVSSTDMLDACLVAADCRLLVLKWDILCPTCRVSAATADVLSNINQHTNCEACDVDFQSNLGEAIELIFQAHPDVRNVDTGKYCIGGPEHAPHVACQLRLQPGERIEVEVPVTTGDYLMRATRLTNQQPVRARAEAALSRLDVSVSKFGTGDQPTVRAGQVSLSILNDMESQQLVRFERIVARKNVVTAAAASSLPRFRELFPHQVFRRDVPMLSQEVTLLAASFTGLEPLYEKLGEAEAYVLLQHAMADLEKCIASHAGAVVRTNGEYLLAAFTRAEDAIKSSFSIMRRLAEDSSLKNASLSIVIHRGQTLITTQNGKLDYFGAVPRKANELLNHAEGRLIITDAVFSDEAVQRLVNSDGSSGEFINIKFKDGSDILAQSVQLYS